MSAVALVVAHPDDEALWLSSIVAAAGRIVFCFGDPFANPAMARARRQAVAALQLPPLVNLALAESGAGFSVDWPHARLTGTGVEIVNPDARARYDANYPRLVEALRGALAGAAEVYTHNPWGEYGHAEHIQVHRAVAALQAELGYVIGFSNYVAAASWPLAQRLAATPCWTRRDTVRPDLATAHALMRLYRRHRAWTWTRYHRWPTGETLYAQPPLEAAGIRRPLSGEPMLDVAGLRWWPPPWRRARRVLG